MVKYKRALQIKADRRPTILEEMGLDSGNEQQLTAAEKKALQLINNLDTELAVDKIVAALATLEDLVKKDAQLIHDDVAAELASFHGHGITIQDPANLSFAYSLLDARYQELGSKGSAGQLARVKALAAREETFTGIVAQRSSVLHPKLEEQLETEVRAVEKFLTASLQKC